MYVATFPKILTIPNIFPDLDYSRTTNDIYAKGRNKICAKRIYKEKKE